MSVTNTDKQKSDYGIQLFIQWTLWSPCSLSKEQSQGCIRRLAWHPSCTF